MCIKCRISGLSSEIRFYNRYCRIDLQCVCDFDMRERTYVQVCVCKCVFLCYVGSIYAVFEYNSYCLKFRVLNKDFVFLKKTLLIFHELITRSVQYTCTSIIFSFFAFRKMLKKIYIYTNYTRFNMLICIINGGKMEN